MKKFLSFIAFSFFAFTAFAQQYGQGYNNTQIPNYSVPAPKQCYNRYTEVSQTSGQHGANVSVGASNGIVNGSAGYQYNGGQTTTTYGTCVPVCAPIATPTKRDRANCDQPRRRN
jgi:hypothetical protein